MPDIPNSPKIKLTSAGGRSVEGHFQMEAGMKPRGKDAKYLFVFNKPDGTEVRMPVSVASRRTGMLSDMDASNLDKYFVPSKPLSARQLANPSTSGGAGKLYIANTEVAKPKASPVRVSGYPVHNIDGKSYIEVQTPRGMLYVGPLSPVSLRTGVLSTDELVKVKAAESKPSLQPVGIARKSEAVSSSGAVQGGGVEAKKPGLTQAINVSKPVQDGLPESTRLGMDAINRGDLKQLKEAIKLGFNANTAVNNPKQPGKRTPAIFAFVMSPETTNLSSEKKKEMFLALAFSLPDTARVMTRYRNEDGTRFNLEKEALLKGDTQLSALVRSLNGKDFTDETSPLEVALRDKMIRNMQLNALQAEKDKAQEVPEEPKINKPGKAKNKVSFGIEDIKGGEKRPAKEDDGGRSLDEFMKK